MNTKVISRIIPYIIYVIAFSLVCSLASQLQTALSLRSLGFSTRPLFLIPESFFHLPTHISYSILQVAAAILTVRELSLRNLFFLSCVFIPINILLSAFSHQIMMQSTGIYFLLSQIGQLLPFVAPILILALIGRKKSIKETAPDVEKEIIPTLSESEVATENETKSKIMSLYRQNWYVFDITLIVILFLYGTLLDPFGLLMYICGLINRMEIAALLVFLWVLSLVPAAICAVVLILRMIISWPKYIENKHRLLLFRLLVIVGLGGYSILPFTPVKSPGINTYIKGFRQYIEAKADIEGIRSWLETLGPDDCVVYNITRGDGSKQSNPKDLYKHEWPEVIDKLRPRYVRLSLDDDKHPKVRLDWGSGFLGTWGLTVGSEAMPTPESDFSRHGEYREQIRNGAYIWYGIK